MSFLASEKKNEREKKSTQQQHASKKKLEGGAILFFLSRGPLSLSSLSFQNAPSFSNSPVRVLAARDLLAVEEHVRDRVEPREDEVDGRVRERRRGVDIKGALERPDLLGDVAVLALVEAVLRVDLGEREREHEEERSEGKWEREGE